LFINIHIDNDRKKEKIKEEQEKITLEKLITKDPYQNYGIRGNERLSGAQFKAFRSTFHKKNRYREIFIFLFIIFLKRSKLFSKNIYIIKIAQKFPHLVA